MNFITRAMNMIKDFFSPNIDKLYEVNSVLTADDRAKICTWSTMYEGKAWENDKYVKSLRLEKDICREFSSVCLNEMEYTLTNEELDVIFKKAIRKLPQGLQIGLALGGFIIKPISTNEVEYISQGNYFPIEYDYNGRITDVVFVEQKQEDRFYTRFERHRLTEQGLEITNRVFVSSTKGNIGNEIDINTVDFWDIEPSILYRGMNRMDFGYYVNPIYSDNIGVSMYDTAKEWILKADVQMSRLEWEFESGERAIHISDRAFKKIADKLNERLYRGLAYEDKNGGDLYKDFSPAFRDDNIINGLEEIKRIIEFNCGLSYGDLSNPTYVAKTATEIKASKERKYNTISSIQEQLRYCLEDLVYALAFYNEMALSYEFVLNFRDSILTDEETERENDRKDIASGIMKPEEYRAKWYGEDIETAKANLPQVVDIE